MVESIGPSFSQSTQDHYDKINVDIHICLDVHQKADEQIKCWDDGRSAWDKELDSTYNALLTGLKDNPAAQGALKQSQDEWNKFRGLEFSSIDQLYKGAPANLELGPDISNDKTWVVQTRVEELQSELDKQLMPLSPAEPIDRNLHFCLAGDKTDAQQKACLEDGIAGWNKELDRQYASLSPAQTEAVKGAQDQWRVFQKAEENFLSKKFPNAASDAGQAKLRLAGSFDLIRDRAIQVSLRESDHF